MLVWHHPIYRSHLRCLPKGDQVGAMPAAPGWSSLSWRWVVCRMQIRMCVHRPRGSRWQSFQRVHKLMAVLRSPFSPNAMTPHEPLGDISVPVHSTCHLSDRNSEPMPRGSSCRNSATRCAFSAMLRHAQMQSQDPDWAGTSFVGRGCCRGRASVVPRVSSYIPVCRTLWCRSVRGKIHRAPQTWVFLGMSVPVEVAAVHDTTAHLCGGPSIYLVVGGSMSAAIQTDGSW